MKKGFRISAVWLLWHFLKLHVAWGSSHCWSGIFSALNSLCLTICDQICQTVLKGRNRLSVCFYCGWFLRPVRCPQVLRRSLNNSILPGQADSQLEIVTRLASDDGHWFSYILCYVELKRASIDTIWLCSVLKLEELAILWLPHHCPPSTPIEALVLLSRSAKIPKMAGNSTSY